MERVEEYLKTEPNYKRPYTNHYGYGSLMGYCDRNGCGKAMTKPRKEDDWNGSTIASYNGLKTYFIDDYVVVITHIHGPWARAEIVKNDLTTQKCYLSKINDNYVIGSSLKEVLEGMREKIIKSKSLNKDIAQAFVFAHPEYEKEYDWNEMVSWHSLDPTSCVDGRRKFTLHADKQTGDIATPKELIEHMKKSSSRLIALEMEKLYLNK